MSGKTAYTQIGSGQQVLVHVVLTFTNVHSWLGRDHFLFNKITLDMSMGSSSVLVLQQTWDEYTYMCKLA